MNQLWHRPKDNKNGTFLVKISKRSKPVEITIPENAKDISTIQQAIAFITKYPHNLMRVSGYKCDNHNKIHKFTFHSCVSLGFPAMYGFDTKKEVIEFARTFEDR